MPLCRWPFRFQVREWGESILSIQPLVFYMSLCVGDIYQRLYCYYWFSWWWAPGCSKHIENWNKYIENNCASSWSFTKNHNQMHGKQNAKLCMHFYGISFTFPYKQSGRCQDVFGTFLQNTTISQDTTKIIVLCFKICFTTTCFGPFL